jgi:hypothetical protein
MLIPYLRTPSTYDPTFDVRPLWHSPGYVFVVFLTRYRRRYVPATLDTDDFACFVAVLVLDIWRASCFACLALACFTETDWTTFFNLRVVLDTATAFAV